MTEDNPSVPLPRDTGLFSKRGREGGSGKKSPENRQLELPLRTFHAAPAVWGQGQPIGTGTGVLGRVQGDLRGRETQVLAASIGDATLLTLVDACKRTGGKASRAESGASKAPQGPPAQRGGGGPGHLLETHTLRLPHVVIERHGIR